VVGRLSCRPIQSASGREATEDGRPLSGQEPTCAAKEKPGAGPGLSILVVIRLGVLAPLAEAQRGQAKAEQHESTGLGQVGPATATATATTDALASLSECYAPIARYCGIWIILSRVVDAEVITGVKAKFQFFCQPPTYSSPP
jgi:hypothetical protein